jgi:Tfp pilus assembly protein PilZ
MDATVDAMKGLDRPFSCFETLRRPVRELPVSRGERRRYPRRTCFMAVDYVIEGRVYRDFVRNISDGGVFIDTGGAFCVGQEVSLSLPYPVSLKRITGKVAWVGDQGIGVNFLVIAPEDTGVRADIHHEDLKENRRELRKMGKIRKKKVRWEPSGSNDVAQYRLYWSKYGEVTYDSESAEIGSGTEVVLPDDVPSFPLVAGDMHLGISAINEAGNESDLTKLTAYFNFVVPEPPQNLEVEDL